MRIIQRLSLTVKIAVMVIFLGVMAATVTAAINFVNVKNSLEDASKSRLVSISKMKSNSLESLFENIERDIKTKATNPTIKSALQGFSAGWNAIEANPQRYLQAEYITNNRHPTGSKDKLDRGANDSLYNDVHSKYHPYLRNVLEDRLILY